MRPKKFLAAFLAAVMSVAVFMIPSVGVDVMDENYIGYTHNQG